MATREQVNRIRELSSEGKSANEIQRTLSREHIGMRRTRLLGYVREFKGKPAPIETEVHIPLKYREKARAPRGIGHGVVATSTVHGKTRRVEMTGSGRSLYDAMVLVSRHPPKKRFLIVGASSIRAKPRWYLDYDERWDKHPEVESV